MGRKPSEKIRFDNPNKKLEWIKKLSPIFHENGIGNYSMEQISEIMNKSKATVYKYFNSKDEIIELIVDFNLARISRFEEILIDEEIEYFERYILSSKVLIESLSMLSVDYLNDLNKYYPKLWKRVLEFQENSLLVLNEYYRKGINMGLFNDINPAILSLNDQIFFTTLINPKFLSDNNLTPKKAFEEYFKLKCYGMLKTDSKTQKHI